MKRLAVIVLVMFTGACGSSHASSPDPGGKPGSRPAVIQMPAGYRNVAFSCFGTEGVYVTSHSLTVELPSGVFVNHDDPHCA
jgi:hypothetical protein